MTRKEQIKFIEDNYPATTHHVSKRAIRHTFFTNIQTELQAYLLGFFASDGSIDEKRKTFRVELQDGDVEIIYLLRDIISKDARIFQNKPREFMGPRGKIIHAHGSTGIDITSSELCTSLVNLGFGYRKSYSELKLPDIREDLLIHFIRGYWDGDGSMSCWYKKQDKIRNENVRFKVDICSKMPSILIDIQKYFAAKDITMHIYYDKRDQMYMLVTSSYVETKKIYHLFYDDAHFYLTRKYKKYSHYVNTEKSRLIVELRNAQKKRDKESNNSSTSAGHPTVKDEGENVC